MVGRPRLRPGDSARIAVALAWLALLIRVDDNGITGIAVAVAIALALLTVGVFFYDPPDRPRRS